MAAFVAGRRQISLKVACASLPLGEKRERGSPYKKKNKGKIDKSTLHKTAERRLRRLHRQIAELGTHKEHSIKLPGS